MFEKDTEILWYVLFAANGKIIKIKSYLEKEGIDFFFPMYYKERSIPGTNNTKPVLYPLLSNMIFVRSLKQELDPVLKNIKIQLNITSDLYYRDRSNKNIIVVPDHQMLNFIAVAGRYEEKIIFLPNEEVYLKKGTKVKIIEGTFKGVEGIFMKIRGDKRVVVSIPNLFSVATAFLPSRFIEIIE